MLQNHLKIAWRAMRRQKGFSAINILGLAVGMACCLLILLFVRDELSYDRHNLNCDRICRLAASIRFGGLDGDIATAPAPMAETLKLEYPEVEETVRLREQGNLIVWQGERNFSEPGILYADPTIFKVFTLPLVRGDARTALSSPYTITLSATAARKYFGEVEPLGKTLRLDNSDDYLVTGVFRDIPVTSHFRFDLIASLSSREESRSPVWFSNNFFTYLLLRPGADRLALERKLPLLVKKYLGPQLEKTLNRSLSELVAAGLKFQYSLQPLGDIHLHSKTRTELAPNGDVRYVWLFSAIAGLILVIAGINFINLATAKASGRAKEVGIRKVLGSERGQLVRQFLVDALLMSGLALGLALILARLALPLLSDLAGKPISLDGPRCLFAGLAALFMAVLVGLLAGIYPAWRLSAARPVEVLKGKLSKGVKTGRLRGVLVVFQFAVSTILIVGTLVVLNQLGYIQGKDLGFQREQVLVLQNAYLLGDQVEAFKNEALRCPGIKTGTISSFLPVNPSNRSDSAFFPKGENGGSQSVICQQWEVDHDYLQTLGMRIVAGRGFLRDCPTDREAVILNQAAARHFGWPDPVGREIGKVADPRRASTPQSFRVVGVVEDFHFESLHSPIEPLLLILGRSTNTMAFRFDAAATTSSIEALRQAWDRFAPGQPFEYAFMDQQFGALYHSEQRLSVIFGLFAGLAVFVACLGLLALAAFMAEQRTKEIGIRKALGAPVGRIVLLLTREYVKWVALATLIAWPLAWYAADAWLSGFAYHAAPGVGAFALATLLTLAVALLTVGYHAVRAARATPVTSLRYE